MSCPLPRAPGSAAILLASGETAAQKPAIEFACRLHGEDILLVRVTTFFSARASSGVLGSTALCLCLTLPRSRRMLPWFRSLILILPASTLPCATAEVVGLLWNSMAGHTGQERTRSTLECRSPAPSVRRNAHAIAEFSPWHLLSPWHRLNLSHRRRHVGLPLPP